MSTPRVSVVMPVYNVASFVEEAIKSVLDQSFTDFELIIVDDGGSDNSLALCKGFDDPRIQIVSQSNRGLAGARNSGIALAKGDYVALLDSDDRWDRAKLLLHVIHLDASPSIDVSYSGSQLIDRGGMPLRQAQRPKCEAISPAHILCRNPVGNGSAPVIRKTALDTVSFVRAEEPRRICYFDEDFRQSEDIEMWTRMAIQYGCTFEGIAPLLTEYRVDSGGLSANMIRQYQFWLLMIEKLRKVDPVFLARHEQRARAYQLRYLARRAVQVGDTGMAALFLRDALLASAKPLFEEPRKTLVTMAAILAGSLLSERQLARLTRRWTGQGAAA